MARYLLSAMPFTGHVSPVCAVAAALIDRGHSVRVYTGTAFRLQVEASGATHVPWLHAPDFNENDLTATFPHLTGKKGMRQLLANVQDVFIETAAAQVADLAAEWHREPWDAIAGDDVSVGAALHAELTGCPWATIAVLPLAMPSNQGPPSGMGLTPGHHPTTRMRDAALRAAVPLLSGPLRKPLAQARADVGLPPCALTFDRAMFSPQLVVASGVPRLDFGRGDRPSSVAYVGVLSTTMGCDRMPPWWGDLNGSTVIYLTQGTQNIDPEDLIRPALEALTHTDALVIVSTGVLGRDDLPFPVAANVRVAGRLPYAALLPRVDVMITNGGWGGTLQALAHGIPLAIAGGDLDKPEVAARVAWARAGVNLKTGRPRAAAIEAACERLLIDSELRSGAEAVAADLAAAGGSARAAELLEGLAGSAG